MKTKRLKFKQNDSYEYITSQVASESYEEISMIRNIQCKKDANRQMIESASYTAILALAAAPIVALALAGAPLSFIAVVAAFLFIGVLSALSALKPASVYVEAVDKVEIEEIEQPHYPNWDEFCAEYDRGLTQWDDFCEKYDQGLARREDAPHYSNLLFFQPAEENEEFFECEQSQNRLSI